MADVKSFRPAPDVNLAVNWNGGGQSYSGRLAQISDRYIEILRHNPPPQMSEAEMNAVCDALNGTLLQPAAMIEGAIELEISDAMPELAQKWSIDKEALLKKLRSMNFAQSVALLEAVEKYWANIRNKRT
jgi:hypothetical protein